MAPLTPSPLPPRFEPARPGPWGRVRSWLGPLGLFTRQYGLFVGAMALVRVLFLWRNLRTGQGPVPASVCAKSFAVGLRFDTSVACYVLLALLPAYLLHRIARRSRFRPAAEGFLALCFGALSGLLFAVLLIDVEYYRTFGTHLNAGVSDYAPGAGEIAATIWAQYPVVWYGLAAAALIGGFWRLSRRSLRSFEAAREGSSLAADVFALPLVAALCVLGARGGLGAGTLNWGSAYFSTHAVANQSALNGAFALAMSVEEEIGDRRGGRRDFYRPEAASRLAREALDDGDSTFLPGASPMLRLTRTGQPRRPLNVVFILLETWMAEHVGILENAPGVTPEFDRLALKGTLFRRFFSSGTRTNRGIASTLFGFPAQLSTSVLKSVVGMAELPGLPSILRDRGYRTAFFYGGDLEFDNMQGFLRANGIEDFAGAADFGRHATDSTWGASDERLFEKALSYMGASARPYFLALLTLSNHEPFDVPPAFRLFSPAEHRDWDYLNAFRYSDAALGVFFREVERRGLDRDTVFVLVADHGHRRRVSVDLDWPRFHIPFLILGPRGVIAPGTVDQIGSQTDIVPTLMHALGGEYRHASWGRDLLGENRRNFALFSHGDFWGLVEGNRYLVDSRRLTPRLYSLGDRGASRDLARAEPQTTEGMAATARAILQATEGQLRPKAAGRR